MKKPSLMLLDEPTNGLDPLGVTDTWQTLENVVAGGCSVLISSHNLIDLDRSCNSATIMFKGKSLVSETIFEIRKSIKTSKMRLFVSDVEKATVALAEAGLPFEVDNKSITVCVAASEAERIGAALAEHSIYPMQLIAEQGSLQEAFLDIVNTARNAQT